jgi:hypothetical protein
MVVAVLRFVLLVALLAVVLALPCVVVVPLSVAFAGFLLCLCYAVSSFPSMFSTCRVLLSHTKGHLLRSRKQ